MSLINNKHIIAPLLDFRSEDDFYHLQIIKRKKEHPELGSKSYIVKTYYIRSIDYLEKKWNEICALCTLHNARAYINLNVRSFERTAFQTLKKVTDQIMNKDFKSVRKAYESVCGEFGTGRDNRWVIDIDEPEISPLMMTFIDYRCEPINDTVYTSKIITKLPTKNGWHLITSPFNMLTFKNQYPDVDVHKNSPTILFIP